MGQLLPSKDFIAFCIAYMHVVDATVVIQPKRVSTRQEQDSFDAQSCQTQPLAHAASALFTVQKSQKLQILFIPMFGNAAKAPA